MTTGLSPLTFPPELYKRLVPSQFLSQHLTSNPAVRPDSRSPKDFRDLSVTTGSLSNRNGSSVVRLGNTIMSCGIRAEITEPDPFHPRQGYVVPNIEIGPLCHSSIRAGPPSEMQQTVAFSLLQTIRNAAVINLEDLCIEEAKAVWVLYIDIICLGHAGSLASAATSAMIAALLSTSLPIARWDLDTNSVLCKHEYIPVKINVLSHVLEFGVFDRVVVADMTDEEEVLCKEKMTVCIDSQGKILTLTKTGGSVLNPQALDQVLILAEQRAKHVDTVIRSSQKYRL